MKIRVFDPAFIIADQRVPGEVICFFAEIEPVCIFMVLAPYDSDLEDWEVYQAVTTFLGREKLIGTIFYSLKFKGCGRSAVPEFVRLCLCLTETGELHVCHQQAVWLNPCSGLVREVLRYLRRMCEEAATLRLERRLAAARW